MQSIGILLNQGAAAAVVRCTANAQVHQVATRLDFVTKKKIIVVFALTST
jgi:hypothetical protein